jgi:hypothetical protein
LRRARPERGRRERGSLPQHDYDYDAFDVDYDHNAFDVDYDHDAFDVDHDHDDVDHDHDHSRLHRSAPLRWRL